MKKKIGAVLVVIALVLVAIYLFDRLKEREEEGVLLLSGNVEVTELNLGFKMSGRIIELAVEEGQAVERGDKLARLDNAELASVVEQNRAALREARARLAEARAGSRTQEIERAAANVSSQEAELVRAKKDFERADYLFKNGAISASQLDAAKSTYENRLGLHKSAREVLSLAKEGPRKEEIEAAESRAGQARAAVRTAEERLRDTVVYAPLSGTILRKDVEIGETVGPGTPVYTIGDLQDPWVKVYVKEDKLGLVKLGQKARVSVDSFPGKAYDGTITFISSEAEFTPKTVQTKEERVKLVFGVKVRVKNPNHELKPGMPADVRILLETK